jgi:hypothetical protein
MTVTLNLPQDIERAFLAEASARGLSLDEFVSTMLLASIAAQQQTEPSAPSIPLDREDGIPVIRTGRPLAISVVDEMLDAIRREREHALLGLAT